MSCARNAHISKYLQIFRGKIRTIVDRVEIVLFWLCMMFNIQYIHASSYFCVVSGHNKTLLKSVSPTEVLQSSRFLNIKLVTREGFHKLLSYL